MKTIQLTLPDEIAKQADEAGLLDADTVTGMIRERLRAQASERWKRIVAEQEANPLPPMTEEEIQAEIDAARAEHRLAVGA